MIDLSQISNRTSSIDVADDLQLYDSDIKAITDGPLAWANTKQGSRRSIHDFVMELEERFQKIGFILECQVWTFGECKCQLSSHHAEQCPRLIPVEGSYMFQGVIKSRMTPESGFDFDKMKHEVRSNLLDISGEGGTIKFDEKDFLRKHGGGKHGH